MLLLATLNTTSNEIKITNIFIVIISVFSIRKLNVLMIHVFRYS